MQVTLLPSSVSDSAEGAPQFLTSYLINDTVAIDAGALGMYGTVEQQSRIKHVLLSHSHMDHIGSLPVLLENAFEGKRDCTTVYGSAAVIESLRRDIFNGRVWPDFIALSTPEAPFLRIQELRNGEPLELDGLRITPVAVEHVVPTDGFIIEDANSAIAIVSDTGPTSEIWRRAGMTAHLQAVFLEATFPELMGWLADVTRHLTPAMFAAEVQKLGRPARIIAVHIKPRFQEQVIRELLELKIPGLEIGRAGHPYTF